MVGILALLFLIVPFAELAIIIQVGQRIGVLETLVALVGISVAGAWLAKREGLGVLTQIRGQLNRGRPPGMELIDGALILFAGALLLTPGFLTDVVALLLLLRPTRAVLRRFLRRRLARHFGVSDPF